MDQAYLLQGAFKDNDFGHKKEKLMKGR